MQVILRLFGRLFNNLFRQSKDVAQALHARGFVDAEVHTIYTGTARRPNYVSDAIFCSALVGMIAHAMVQS